MPPKLYCYCFGGMVLHGPMFLPDITNPHNMCPYLYELSEEELIKLGWLPWVIPKYPYHMQATHELIAHRFCTETYASEYIELVPRTEAEYLYLYGERLKCLITDIPSDRLI